MKQQIKFELTSHKSVHCTAPNGFINVKAFYDQLSEGRQWDESSELVSGGGQGQGGDNELGDL